MHEKAKMLEKDVKYGIGMLQYTLIYVHVGYMIIVPCVRYVHGIIQSELFIAIHACVHMQSCHYGHSYSIRVESTQFSSQPFYF